MWAAEFTSQVVFSDSVYLKRVAYQAYIGFSFQKWHGTHVGSRKQKTGIRTM
jgi:hypothetical protein